METCLNQQRQSHFILMALPSHPHRCHKLIPFISPIHIHVQYKYAYVYIYIKLYIYITVTSSQWMFIIYIYVNIDKYLYLYLYSILICMNFLFIYISRNLNRIQYYSRGVHLQLLDIWQTQAHDLPCARRWIRI